MSTSYPGSIIKHLTEIVETLEEGGTVISPRRLGQVVQTQLCVQADTTRIKHGIRHLQRLDEVEGIHEKVKVDENDINEIVGRFLSWRLPSNFGPDGGISYSKRSPGNEPVGTNLFSATQTEQMVRHILGNVLNRERGNDLGPRPAEPEMVGPLTGGRYMVPIHHLIGDTVLIDGDISATVSEILIYDEEVYRYKCEYFHQGENKAPWIQASRLQPVDPNP